MAPLAAVIGLVLLGAVACGESAQERRAADPRPNVLLISMDTTRPDHLSVYGYERDTAPHLSRLAEQGVLFSTAYAPSATTGPSHASLFTSLYPMTHGVEKNGSVLDSGFDTLAEVLGRNGFETAGVVSSFVLGEKFGYGQGFAHFDADFSRANTPSGTTLWEGRAIEGKFYGSAEDTTRRALEWLDGREARDAPFFLFVHYFDPHDPYTPPRGFRPPFRPGPKAALKLERQIFFYDTLLAFTDAEIGRLLQGLDERGLDANTLVVVTGDHGEGLRRHGHLFHGVHIYEEGVRVPLLMRWPGHLAAGARHPDPVALMDLAPTLYDLVGVDRRGLDLRGESLAPLLRGEGASDPERPVYLYRRRYEGGEVADGIYAKGEKFGVRVGRWKYIEGPEEETRELFDLEADPLERENLVEREPERAAALALLVARWRAAHTAGAVAQPPLSEEDRARLEALGYLD